jgi:Leucine-rich repeat (LRR) protein
MTKYNYKDLIDKNIVPDDCTNFSCRYCNLDKLPVLPDGLTKLYCDNNNLTELPVLPDRLTELHCFHNKITELPKLPNGLEKLYCHSNPIKYITPDMYSIMRNIYLTVDYNIDILNTIFYDQSGCSSNAEFFGIE